MAWNYDMKHLMWVHVKYVIEMPSCMENSSFINAYD